MAVVLETEFTDWDLFHPLPFPASNINQTVVLRRSSRPNVILYQILTVQRLLGNLEML